MNLNIEFEWLDAPGVTTPELAATWASFRLECGGGIPTRIADLKSKSIREHLYIPLYPIAEWYATRKWTLLHEVYSPARGALEAYMRRHSWRGHGDGHPLPPIVFLPEGSGGLRMLWKSGEACSSPIAFIDAGEKLLKTPELEHHFDTLVETVISRLETLGIHNTPLQEEWNALAELSPPEVEYCISVGRMGLDPFSSIENTEPLLSLSESELPDTVKQDLLDAASLHDLHSEIQLWHSFTNKNTAYRFSPPSWLTSMPLENLDPGMPPHLRGYQIAHRCRSELGVNGNAYTNDTKLAKALDVPTRAVNWFIQPRSYMTCTQGFIQHENKEWVSISGTSKKAANRRFAFLRGVHALLRSEAQDTGALLTSASSDKQKEGRAFAAEFLAPRARVVQEVMDEGGDEHAIEKISQTYGVSPLLIENQLKNAEYTF